ncbi:unnamed protein product [Adineta ricciae]|uniref:TM2 domain-containing protein n=1 Tax=Adineta ricciae TaxID=249248 RepID=A0A814YJF1_ADIRI|nr:unnamed protein product [Adineta ricciae]CAF1229743.1 unnamed protein product [Adineta ricciae]
MAKFTHLLFCITLITTLISAIYTISLPTNETAHGAVVVTNNENGIVVKVPVCYGPHDCGHGKCIENRTSCQCERGWITVNSTNASEETKYCNYQQRSKKTAFFLSFFVGVFGVDWFYLCRSNLLFIFAGILKLFLGLSCGGVWFSTCFASENGSIESSKSKFRAASTFFSLLTFAWWIVDWSRILGNRFPDGNGNILGSW